MLYHQLAPQDIDQTHHRKIRITDTSFKTLDERSFRQKRQDVHSLSSGGMSSPGLTIASKGSVCTRVRIPKVMHTGSSQLRGLQEPT